MKRNIIGSVMGAAAAALVVAGCATTQSAQEVRTTRSETSSTGPGVNYVQPTGTRVKRNVLTSSEPYTGIEPGERIVYDPPERLDVYPPNSPK